MLCTNGLWHHYPLPANVQARIGGHTTPHIFAFAQTAPAQGRGMNCTGDIARIRVHESGHAVCALALWSKHPRPFIDRVSAHTHGGQVAGNDPVGATAFERVIVSAAGPVADEMFQAARSSLTRKPIGYTGHNVDKEHAEELIGEKLTMMQFESACDQAKTLLRSNWSAVAVGAELLAERGEVNGDTFEAHVKPYMWAG